MQEFHHGRLSLRFADDLTDLGERPETQWQESVQFLLLVTETRDFGRRKTNQRNFVQ
jgi:hypothetical protein